MFTHQLCSLVPRFYFFYYVFYFCKIAKNFTGINTTLQPISKYQCLLYNNDLEMVISEMKGLTSPPASLTTTRSPLVPVISPRA